MNLEEHTVATLRDELSNTVLRTETWVIPSNGKTWAMYKTVTLRRLQQEGASGNHDVLTVEIEAHSGHGWWTYLWSSDPDYPWEIDNPRDQRVFPRLPDDVCDLIESATQLDMHSARGKVQR